MAEMEYGVFRGLREVTSCTKGNQHTGNLYQGVPGTKGNTKGLHMHETLVFETNFFESVSLVKLRVKRT
jgi:hypothetical protein